MLELGAGMGAVGLMSGRFCEELTLSDGFERIRENLHYNVKLNSNIDLPSRCLNAKVTVSHLDYANPSIGNNP